MPCAREAALTTVDGAPEIASGRSRRALASYSHRILSAETPGSTPRMSYQLMPFPAAGPDPDMPPMMTGSAVHQREDAPAQVIAPVPDVAGGGAVKFRPQLARQLIARVGVQPPADVQPLRGGVPVPAVLVGQHHLHDVAAELAEIGRAHV